MNKKLIGGLLIVNLVSHQMTLLAHVTPEYTEENKTTIVTTNENNNIPTTLKQITIEDTKSYSINNMRQATRVNYASESITEPEIRAKGICGSKLTWILYNDGTLKISGKGKMNDYYTTTIPWKDYIFTKVVVEDGVTSIGTNAFQGCSALENIEIPSSVESIGTNAFQGCESLTKVILPCNLKTIEQCVFDGCISLESIEIPSKVTEIGMYAFEGCIALTSIKIPSSVTKIKENAFNSCTALKSIEMPDSIKFIGASIFSGCSALKFINYQGTESEWNDINMKTTIPNQIILYFSTHFRMEGITNLILLTTVQDALIDTYQVLKKDGTNLRFTPTPDVESFEPSNEKLAEIADSIVGIETISFKDNVFTITEAIIPEEPEEPTEPAKSEEVEEPTEAIIPEEPEEPAKPEEPEEPTEPAKSEEVEEPTEPTKPEEVKEPTEPIKLEEVEEPTESTILEEVEEPTEITKPEESEELTESTKPEEVEEAEELTEPIKPEESEELTESTTSEEVEESTEITISEKVEPTEIIKPEEVEEPTEPTKPEEAEEPTKPTMPETLEVLEKLETLEIPNKQIEDTFFITNADNNQDQITEIIITGIKENVDITDIKELEIPSEINGIPVVVISANAFANSPNLTKVTIAEGIKTIGDGAFENCPKLAEIILPQGVETIGDSAFKECSSLKTIVLPNSLETIGENAFNNSGLIEVIIPNSVTYVGKGTFEGCENLIHIILPESLGELEEDLCNGCSALEKVYIVTSDNNRSIEDNIITMMRKTVTMPRALKNRTNIMLPRHTKLSRIKANAFKGCINLKNIYYGGTKEEWNAIEIDSSNDVLSKVSIHYLSESNYTNTDTTQLDDQPITDTNKLPTDANELPTDMKPIDTNQLPTDINESPTDTDEPLTDINKLQIERNQLPIDTNQLLIDTNKLDDTNQSVTMNTSSSTLSNNIAFKLSNKYLRRKIKTNISTGGSLKLNTNYTTKGTNVKVTVVRDNSYKLDKFTVTDANGKTIQTTKKSGTYTFLMPDTDVTVSATFVIK